MRHSQRAASGHESQARRRGHTRQRSPRPVERAPQTQPRASGRARRRGAQAQSPARADARDARSDGHAHRRAREKAERQRDQRVAPQGEQHPLGAGDGRAQETAHHAHHADQTTAAAAAADPCKCQLVSLLVDDKYEQQQRLSESVQAVADRLLASTIPETLRNDIHTNSAK